jgi:CheY-like chemotaxis protein
MKKRILIVEDQPAVADISILRLGGREFNAEIATNEVEAKKKLAQHHYDLCILDIRTPGLSGMDFYCYLKRKRPRQSVKVIFTTGDSQCGTISSFSRKTERPCLRYPFAPKEFKSIIEAATTQAC